MPVKNCSQDASAVDGKVDPAVTIRLNGDAFELAAGTSVGRLVELLELKGDRVAVEVDHEIVRREDWDATTIGAGAAVEVVHFVGGG